MGTGTSESNERNIIAVVVRLLIRATADRASDIHIEPRAENVRIRFRIDGVLVERPGFNLEQGASIASRLKVMSELDISEKRLPQDGKIQVSIGEGRYDLRVSLLPTPHGESLNIRILTRSSIFNTLSDLGFLEDELTAIHGFIERPHGIILVTGPTGSGKSTTLYSALNRLNQTDRKTITIEDPIEYQLKGITQMQVLPQ